LVLAATAVAFLFCPPLGAQLNTGRISGQITDQSGGAIAGATVTVIDVARGENRALTGLKCRCGSQVGILRAVRRAAKVMQEA